MPTLHPAEVSGEAHTTLGANVQTLGRPCDLSILSYGWMQGLMINRQALQLTLQVQINTFLLGTQTEFCLSVCILLLTLMQLSSVKQKWWSS